MKCPATVGDALRIGGVDLGDPKTYEAGMPYQAFRALRQRAPVAWHPYQDGPGFWALTAHTFCLGASLARAEAAAMFPEVLARMQHLELDGPVVRTSSAVINGIRSMPVRFTPGHRRAA